MYFSSTDVAGGALMIGLPSSGKTTSLHSIICTLSMLYPLDELELYLIDAKHGVEFKAYEALPHARMVSVHSDREFSLAVLKSIEKEIQRRAELMKSEGSGRANLTEYRQATGAMPAMDRPTLLLLPQRVAFMCNDYDAEIVMTGKAALRTWGVHEPGRCATPGRSRGRGTRACCRRRHRLGR